MGDKTTGFCTFSHRRATPSYGTCRATQPHLSQIRSVCKRVRNYLFRTGTLCHLKMAPADANPAELRALLAHVYHTTWTGSRWMFEKMLAA